MKDGPYEHCFAVDTWEEILVLVEFKEENGPDLHDKLHQPRVLGELLDARV